MLLKNAARPAGAVDVVTPPATGFPRDEGAQGGGHRPRMLECLQAYEVNLSADTVGSLLL